MGHIGDLEISSIWRPGEDWVNDCGDYLKFMITRVSGVFQGPVVTGFRYHIE